MIKLAILTEGGIGIGLGHITRCLALYQSFEELYITPLLIINSSSKLDNIFGDYNFIIKDWINNKNVFDIIKDYDIVVIDSYLAKINFYNNISKLVPLIVSIDDYNRIKYPRGIVVNGSIFAKEINYPYNKKLTYILGTEYCLLRKEFWNPHKKIYKQNKTVLLLFGGSELAIKISKQIYQIITLNFPEMDKILIVPNHTSDIFIDKKTKIFVSPTFKETFELMKSSDIAVTASGQTIYELLCLGIPSIVCSISDNQSMNEQILEENGLVLSLGNLQNLDNIDHNKLISKLNKLINDRILYESLSIKGQELIDGKGSLKSSN